ncbi:hypothetical protein AKJ08_0595 [Vulgatibacter incomptus]|uniref:PilZ domain-containing protein n=1 Tax=Vulgatibacter incomptus TaxID=1391653 RepID=A0A0K1P9L1_9BACT|nr:hypothetical protein AKJ08_0595 [Vulgatibacter incomptus]
MEAGFPVSLRAEGHTLVRIARNLSMTGLLVDGVEAAPGARFVAELRLPDEQRTLSITCEVLGTVRHDGTRALHFLDLDWDDMFALARFLAPRLG